MDRDVIGAFFERHYHPANLVLVAAGTVDHAALVAAGKTFPTRTAGRRPARDAPAPTGPLRRRSALKRPLEQAHVAAAWPALPADDPDRYALAVANQVLGGGLASRLFQEIREDRGLAYSVYSSVASYSDAGSVVAYAGTGAERAGEVCDLIVGGASAMAADGVTGREWEVAKGYLEGSFVLGLEDSGSVMGRLGSHVSARGHVVSVDEQLARLAAVTLDDVNRVARRILGSEPAVCGVGPLTERQLTA